MDPLGRAWRFMTSVRLALVLILVIAAAVLAGTLLMQAPPSVVADPVAYDQWLERARSKYGLWTDPFAALQLFNVFHSLWFRLLVGLLTANIIVCSVNRWKGIWATAFRTRTRMREAFFDRARFNARLETAMPAAEAAERVGRAISHARYRVQTEADNTSVAVYADKNRLCRFGTLFSHLSIVLILVGVVVGGIWGFSDPEFIVAEGSVRDVGMGTGLSVGLDHFTDEYYLEGPPKDFRSDLVIYENGVEVKRGTVRVNSPLSYHGVQFHQSFYGQAAVLAVRDEGGAVVFDEGVPLAWRTGDVGRPFGSFNLPEQGLVVYVIGPASGMNDPLIPAGETRVEVYDQATGALVAMENLTQGTGKELAGLNFTFERERRFTGLKVVKDPGVNIIWAAAGLMILGLVMLFYFPYRRLWALCQSRPDGTTEVRLGTTAQRDLSQEQEFGRLRDRVRRALGAPREGGDSGRRDDDA
jgi:cytochrome c biogenesis protein